MIGVRRGPDRGSLPSPAATTAAAGVSVLPSAVDHVHPRSMWDGADHGYLAWAFDPGIAAGATGPVSGTLNFIRLHLPRPAAISQVVLYVSATGSSLTTGRNFAGLWTPALGLIALTADQTSSWGSGGAGERAMDLANGPFVRAAGDVLLGFWSVGSTTPTFSRSASNAGVVNTGLTDSTARWAASSTGLTTTAPDPAAALSRLNVSTWGAVKGTWT